MLKPFNYTNSKILNNYDLINKFNFKSIYELPHYTKIESKIFIKNSSLIKVTDLQMQSIYYYYLLGLINVYLKFNYVALNSVARLRSVSIESEIKSKISRHLLFDFLFNYYLILNKISRSFILLQDFSYISKKSGKLNLFNLMFYIPANTLIEKREQLVISFDDLKIFILCQIQQPTLYFYNKKKNKNFQFNSLYFKNIFPFWAFD